MNWHARLAEYRAGKDLRGRGEAVPKVPKAPFVTFDTEQDGHPEKITALPDPADRYRIRAAMLALVDSLGLDHAIVYRLPEQDMALWAQVPPESLRAYVLALDDTATRQAGKVPRGDTTAIYCARCGPVWAHPDIAACLPVVNGWPRALGCPWCFIRKAGGYIPLPHVACGTCEHFTPDRINPPAGIGRCACGPHYPMQQPACGMYRPVITKEANHD